MPSTRPRYDFRYPTTNWLTSSFPWFIGVSSVSSSAPKFSFAPTSPAKTTSGKARIVRTEGEIDRTSRMVHAVAEVTNPYGRAEDRERPPLAVGMFVEAEIQGVVAENVAVLPRAALRNDGRVLVVDSSNRLRFRKVDVFRQTSQEVIIRSGLESGETVLLSPLGAVTDGMEVRIASDDGTLATPFNGERAP